MKIGFAKDIHQLIKTGSEASIVLGGYHISNLNYKIKATSDGDIILHALTSAILGALEMLTLGEYFPDTDKVNIKRSSRDFLQFALQAMKEKNYLIESLDLCIVCEQIMLKDYLPKIKEKLLEILNIKGLGIKCTRYEDKNNLMIECYASIILNEKRDLS